MKAIVIYSSKTGFTKKYAQWISDALNCQMIELRSFKKVNLENFDAIIFGGGLYVGGINGLKKIRPSLSALKNKKIVVFATGATPNREETIEELMNKNFSSEQQKIIRFYYLRGGFQFSKLCFTDKILMLLLKLKLKLKPAKKRNSDEKGMLAAYAVPADFTRIRNIDGILNYVLSGKDEK